MSVDGGTHPRWRGDGQEVFWIAPDGMMMAASVSTTPGLSLGEPMALFQSFIFNAGRGPYDVSADGQRFVIQQQKRRPIDELSVIVNWQSLLKD